MSRDDGVPDEKRTDRQQQVTRLLVLSGLGVIVLVLLLFLVVAVETGELLAGAIALFLLVTFAVLIRLSGSLL